MNKQQPVIFPLDIAFVRWSVVCKQWGYHSSGSAPILQAFLAGWLCRCVGTTIPVDVGQCRDSFCVGWREADQQIDIHMRELDYLATIVQPITK